MVNSVQDPAVSISCVTLSHAPSMLWTSGPNSAANTTASLSGAGTTSGSPTPKWTVSWPIKYSHIKKIKTDNKKKGFHQ